MRPQPPPKFHTPCTQGFHMSRDPGLTLAKNS